MVTQNTRELIALDEVSRLLAEATSLEEIRNIRDKAEAARTYVKAARLGLELQNRAAEVKLRAERKAGKFLHSLRLRGGNRKSNGQNTPVRLDDLGISRDQSKRWQKIASVPDGDFAQYIKTSYAEHREITSAGLLRIAFKSHEKANSKTCKFILPIQTPLAPVDDLLLELTNHCHLLADVLRPVYEEGPLDLPRAERRIVGRLIGEMSQLITQLKRTWTSTSRTL